LAGFPRLAVGLAVVVATMIVLFTVPAGYFVAATFASTSCMIVAAFYLGGLKVPKELRYRSILLGLLTATGLYLVFYAGGAAVDLFHPLGITSASESSIYSLVASPSNPLYVQMILLLFDSAGYESFFRGVLQSRLQTKVGPAAAVLVALLDAGLHVATLNPIWVGGTFVTDLVWGLTYYYGKGLQGSFTSHYLWDLAIFVLRPIT
jgi:membrane protease YdiL (CAAX protease family)